MTKPVSIASKIHMIGIGGIGMSGIAGVLLDLLSLCREALWLSGSPGRSLNLALPPPPVVAALGLALAGWLALH